ncbi:MAG: hypothetical protein ACLPXW_09475 [Xanthobacteraceae bacterium]
MRAIRTLVVGISFVVCSLFAFAPAHAQVDIDVSIDVAPPPLPVYDQPPIPEPGYLWAPGYWAWDDDVGYYWVPGTWVLPPEPDLLWTPGYWGWNDGVYGFHAGYWGPHIGFYGGVAYGFGYTGAGYEGGYWRNGAFFYNRTVNNIGGVSITNVYNKTVVVNNTTNVSYNGGTGGTTARATPEQLAAANEHHVPATAQQIQHREAAARDPALSLNANHGHPTVAATAHAAVFKGSGVISAHPGQPVSAVQPQGHRVGNQPGTGNAVTAPGAKPGNAATVPGNKPGLGNGTTAPGSKVGPGNAGTVPGNAATPQVHDHKGKAGGSTPSGSGPQPQAKTQPNAALPPTPHVSAPPPPPPHAVKPPPPPARVAAPRPPPPPPPRKPPPPAKKCPPGQQHC